MSDVDDFNIAALEAIADVEKLLQISMKGIETNKAKSMKVFLYGDDKLSEESMLGVANFSLIFAKGQLNKKRYKDFFMSLISASVFGNTGNKELDEKLLRSEIGRVNAIKRHAENYALKQQAIDYWREHINPKLSNPKAADLLIKVVPLSHRKLVEYVAEAKRENIRPAS